GGEGHIRSVVHHDPACGAGHSVDTSGDEPPQFPACEVAFTHLHQIDAGAGRNAYKGNQPIERGASVELRRKPVAIRDETKNSAVTKPPAHRSGPVHDGETDEES